MAQYIIPFNKCSYDNRCLVGGKNASLGELYKINKEIRFGFANGFAITTVLYDEFINSVSSQILEILNDIDYDSVASIYSGSEEIRGLILSQDFNKEMREAITQSYLELEKSYLPTKITVAIRSSAVAEDMADASFAGQQDTYLNICGIEEVLDYIKRCFASLFNAQVVSYRHSHAVELDAVKLSVGVQKMVRSDLGSSGVAFSLDPESGYRGVVVVNSIYGLGEMAVGGHVIPDEFTVDKRLVDQNSNYPILSKKLGKKEQKMVYSGLANRSEATQVVDCNRSESESYSLFDSQARELARIVIELEKVYQNLFNSNQTKVSVDVEWALEGDQIYIIQTRPETVHSVKTSQHRYILDKPKGITPILEGIAVGEMVSSGKIRRLKGVEEFSRFEDGDILVVQMTTPDWEPIMKRSGGIITDKGSRTCHAAIIARELGINAVVGTEKGTQCLEEGVVVTVSCSEGEIGRIYQGELSYEKESLEIDKDKIKELPIKMMLNVGNPETAFSNSLLPHRGIGLTRMEFTINSFIRVHPLALINYQSLQLDWKEKIDEVIGLNHPTEFFVDQLAMGLGKIASSFYPEDVIVRFSDFKTNEYRNLLGGVLYEPEEENPMLGWRGCSRYYSESYREAFGLECRAIKRLREEMGLENVIVMLPFCRTPEECEKVLEVMSGYGLTREKGLKVYLMCEIPSNVLQAKEFSQYVDGVSIGGNDLFQLTLGIDRDSSIQISDHTNKSYRKLIKQAIKKYKKRGVKVGFCGQQPSESLGFCRFLIDCGIDSVSVIPDTVIKTINSLMV